MSGFVRICVGILCFMHLSSCGGGHMCEGWLVEVEHPDQCMSGRIERTYDEVDLSVQARTFLYEGHSAVGRQDYEAAFTYFYAFSLEQPDEVRGHIFCAQAKYLGGKPDEALVFYDRAARTGVEDPRIARGIARCRLAILEKELEGAMKSVCSDEEDSIVGALEGFLKSLDERNWDGVAANSSLYDLVRNTGSSPYTEEILRRDLEAYMAMVTLDAFRKYWEIMTVERVMVDHDNARIDFKSKEAGLEDSVYLKRNGTSWEVVLLSRALVGGM